MSREKVVWFLIGALTVVAYHHFAPAGAPRAHP
jgi:hypothetical protein